MKSVLIALGLALAVVLAGKYHFESKVEDGLNLAAQLISPVASLRFRDVSLGFDGNISITGIALNPHAAKELITIEEIVLASSDPLFWVTEKSAQFSNEDFPELLELKIRKLAADTSLLERLTEGDACRSLKSYFNYSTIGVRRAETDIDLALNFANDYRPRLSASIDDGRSSMDIEASFVGSNLQRSVSQQRQLPLEDIRSSVYIDESIAQKLIDRCSEEMAISSDEYLDAVAASPSFSQDYVGFDLGADFRQALATWLKGGSTLSISARPKAQLRSLDALQFYKPPEVVKALRMTVELDSQEVPLNPALTREDVVAGEEVIDGEDIVDGDGVEAAENAAAASENQNQTVEAANVSDERLAQKNKQTKEEKRGSFKTADVESAERYLNTHVRIDRVGDKSTVIGWLLGVERDRLEVEVRGHSRNLIYKIHLDDVTKFEVYR